MKKEIELNMELSEQAKVIVENLKDFDEDEFMDMIVDHIKQNYSFMGDTWINKYLLMKKAKEKVKEGEKNGNTKN